MYTQGNPEQFAADVGFDEETKLAFFESKQTHAQSLYLRADYTFICGLQNNYSGWIIIYFRTKII